jgi:hypothetical protein
VTARLDTRLVAIAAIAVVWCGALGAWHVTHAPPVAIAAAFDLVVTAGVVAYLLGVRGRLLAATIAAGALAAKLVLGRVLIVAGVLELATLAVVIVRVRRARRAWRAARAHEGPHAALVTALSAILPALAAELVATELAVIGYAITGWRRRTSTAFAVHRASGWPLIAGVFAVLTLVEAPAVHLVLVAAGAPTVAWIASALALYGAAWLVGDAHALRHGGVRLDAHELAIELGVRWRGRIAYAAIARVTRGAGPVELDVAIAGANVVISLREPAELVGLFGRRRRVCSLALELDEPDAFIAALAKHSTEISPCADAR